MQGLGAWAQAAQLHWVARPGVMNRHDLLPS
jgi:hypothetical protein